MYSNYFFKRKTSEGLSVRMGGRMWELSVRVCVWHACEQVNFRLYQRQM